MKSHGLKYIIAGLVLAIIVTAGILIYSSYYKSIKEVPKRAKLVKYTDEAFNKRWLI